MSYSLIIWDFNGTILNDVNHCINCVNKLLKKRNLKTINSIEEYRKLFRFPVVDYYKAAGFDFDTYPYDVLAHEWIEAFLARENELTAMPNAIETIEKIHANGIKQIVLSSCEITMLTRELKMLGLYDFFDAVLGLDNIYAGGKIEMAKKWAGSKIQNAVLIGDTDHDYNTAQELGADCILYSGGHSSKEKLLSFNVPVIDDISEILSQNLI